MKIECMEPIRRGDIAKGDAFLHQIKWDGIRGIVSIGGGRMTIATRKGRDYTAAYPELKVLPDSIASDSAVLDGELVVFVDGRPSFYHILQRSRTKNVSALVAKFPVRYVVFDLLFLGGEDLRPRPLTERQALLADCLTPSAAAAPADSFDDGDALFDMVRRRGMEGIVSKRRSSAYTPGKKHSDWYKTKTAKKMLCAITGVSQKDGVPSSLTLGVFRDGVMTPVGRVGSGVKPGDLAALAKIMHGKNKPQLVCWVKFAEWTPSGTLRHPVFLGFVDHSPEEAAGEELIYDARHD
jgi:bifunctional non-homologous end joining protein LigD